MRSRLRSLIALPALLAAQSVAAEPAVEVPAGWDGPASAAPAAPMTARWWDVFGDPALDAVMAQVDAGNTSLAAAAARLEAAQGAARIADAALLPQVSLAASADRASGPLVNDAGGSGSLYVARASLAWEIDLGGVLSDSRAAARLDASAAEALLRDARLLVETRAAAAWYRTAFLSARADQSRERERLLAAKLELVARRVGLGLAAGGDERAVAAALGEARTATARLEQGRDGAYRELAFLCGGAAADFPAAGPLADAPTIPAGIPADMLARRPDVAAAIAGLAASQKRLSASRKSWLPSLALTATGGTASPSLGSLLSAASRDFGIGLLLGLPLFDGGRHKAEVRVRRAELSLAEATYREAVLGALRETNDALQAVAAERTALSQAEAASTLADTDLATTRARVAAGTAGALGQIDAELARNERAAAELERRFALTQATLLLLRSLGGGW